MVLNYLPSHYLHCTYIYSMREQEKRFPGPVLVFFGLLLSGLLLFGCRNDKVPMMVTAYSLPSMDSCLFEPDHHYFITQPDHTLPEQKFPLVIAIDPHGDGLLALQEFRDALKDLPVAIVGSSKLRNNCKGFELSLENLHNDLLAKYPVDPDRVIIAGFSGGARMAFYYGSRNPVYSIIMFGAGPGQIRDGFQEKQIYAVSGTRDFNFSEQYRPLFIHMDGNSAYVNDYFRGTHEWPPGRNIREAVVYCLRNTGGPVRTLSNSLSENFVKEADSLEIEGDFLFAGKALEKAYFFAEGKKRQDFIKVRINDFQKDPDWIASQQKIQNSLQSETKKKRLYADNLQDPDLTWWTGELDNLFTQITSADDPLDRDYYARLKGFLGIYLYSRINTLLQQGNTSDLMDKLITIYERVEPGSEDLEFFKVSLSQLRA